METKEQWISLKNLMREKFPECKDYADIEIDLYATGNYDVTLSKEANEFYWKVSERIKRLESDASFLTAIGIIKS